MEDFSSDHAAILQRVYNFLFSVLGSDPQRLHSLVSDDYIPEFRAMLCGKEWTQLNYGWWTALEPHLTRSYKKETEAVRQQAHQNIEDETRRCSPSSGRCAASSGHVGRSAVTRTP